MTVYECATLHGIDLGPANPGGLEERKHSDEWTEELFGEGPNSAFDHVMISNKWSSIVGKRGAMEDMMLDQAWDPEEIKDNSRLACMIILTKEMDGMSVYIPDGLPSDCP